MEVFDAAELWSRDQIEHTQLTRLKATVAHVRKSEFYRRRLDEAGVTPESITSLDDIRRIPFTTKQDLRDQYPTGLLCVPRSEIVRMHCSSGTTGSPVAICHTQNDINSWADLMARCLYMVGVRRDDVFQNMSGYGLFTGGLGIHFGAERLGCMTIPAGPGNSRRQIKLAKDFKTTVAHILPSYALILGEHLRNMGEDPRDFPLRIAVVGAEPYTVEFRRRIEELFDMKAYNSYGLSEMNGPGVAFECQNQNGLHVWEDAYLPEIVDPKTGELLASREEMITYKTAEEIVGAGITSLKIRSVINCRAKNGACSRCYGANLSNNAPVAIGEAVGIIAAQSIGEPGTQLTMRTFHTGGIASASDITQGLPRVEELFEARKPKSVAVIAHNGGLVSFDKDNKGVDVVKVDDPQTGDHFEHQIVFGSKVRVHEGDLIEKGTMITEGSADPSEVLLVNGELSVQEYLIREVQMVYRTQGVDINDKHIEVIVRQMMKKVRIEEPGDTDYIRGMMADRAEVLHLNEQIDRENAEDGGSRQKATYTAILQGITKASLATDSFMSAASFQETTRVLTEAAIKGKVDPLQGLKENVIIGKLIPAGTGLVTYTEEEKAEEEADEANLEALMASTNAIVM